MPSVIKVDQIQSDTGNVAISGNVSSTLRVSNTSFPLIVRSGGTNHITMFDTRSSTGVGTMIGANQDGNTYYDSNYNGTATAGGHIWRSGGSGILTLGATGLLTTTAGIRFPATQVADADANTLDDYEEGSWTPLLSSNGDGVLNATMTLQRGRYVKIGKIVWLSCRCAWSSIAGMQNGWYAFLGSLPFTPASGNDVNGAFFIEMDTGSSHNNTWAGFIGPTVPYVRIRYNNISASPGWVTRGDVGAGAIPSSAVMTFETVYTIDSV